ncbi:MAG: hypothetical protein AAF514_11500 [Verrucomicrobiota bacterium]
MRLISIILIAIAQFLCAGNPITLEDAKTNGMLETLRNYIRHNPVIADICVYEQEWIPPSKKFRKGRLVQRAVVTHVHRGPIRIGDQVEYVHYIEEDRGLYQKGVSTVRGKLRTFFVDSNQYGKVVDGVLKISGDAHWGFNRIGDDVFAQLFALELKTNRKLKHSSSMGQQKTELNGKTKHNSQPHTRTQSHESDQPG